jgi:hypothetical protein
MRDMASELRIWPPIWKRVRGSVVMIKCRLGGLIPNFKKGIVVFRRGYRFARAARNIHHEETNPNCTSVRVIGLGRAVRMALEDVLEKMDVMYQIAQSVINLGDTGALSASVISWTFWLTLPFLVLIVRNASLKLFCLPCLVAGACVALFKCPYLESLLGCHRSEEDVPFACGGFGLGEREELSPCDSSSCVGSRSGWKAGNLKVVCALESGCEAVIVSDRDRGHEDCRGGCF